MATKITTISFDMAKKVIGNDRLKRLISVGVVKCVRRVNVYSQAHILIDSLPQRYRLEAYQLTCTNPSLTF